MKPLFLLLVLFAAVCAHAAPNAGAGVPADIPTLVDRLPTELSQMERERVAKDTQVYPHFMAFLKTVEIPKHLFPTDIRDAALVHTRKYFDPNEEMWTGFFKAAAADHLTCLRAFALVARKIKESGYVTWGLGTAFERSVADNKVDLGLALPARNIAAAAWSPDPSIKDPEFLVHLKIFYTEPYIHQFPDEILPANLKIGEGAEETYWYGGKSYSQHTVETDLYYGPVAGVGFRNVKGIGGQKRGLMGFMQKMLFFLPDAIDSMTINEQKDTMITEALVNTTVAEFETNPLYSVKLR